MEILDLRERKANDRGFYIKVEPMVSGYTNKGQTIIHRVTLLKHTKSTLRRIDHYSGFSSRVLIDLILTTHWDKIMREE